MEVLEQQIVEAVRSLPAAEQQQVLDFVEFLKIKKQKQPINAQKSERPLSALEAAGDLIGCVEGPGDLSTNKRYMEGFGQS